MTAPPLSSAVIRGAWVVTMESEGLIPGGAVWVEDGRIREVGTFEEISAKAPGVNVVGDGTGIVSPGLINAHTHLSEALVPGMGSEMTLFEWGQHIVSPVGNHITARMAEYGTLLKAAEMLRSGVTYVNDMFVHANSGSRASLGVVDGLTRAGLKGCVSFGAEDAAEGVTAMDPMSVDEIMDEHQELVSRADESDLLDFRFGIGTLLGQSDELLEAGVAACAENGWSVHTHLAEVREEIVQASLRWGERPIPHAATVGLLDFSVVAGHVIWVTEPEIDLLADSSVSGSYNPVANMILGSGVCPVPRLRSAGIWVGVGTDGAASNDSQNMLETIKMAALLQKVSVLDPAVISAEDVLTMATIDGAKALGIDQETGSIAAGKSADIVLFGGTEELAAIHDPYQQIVYCSSPRSVSDVWVSGRHLLSSGVLTHLDSSEIVAKGRELARELVGVSGLRKAGHSKLPLTEGNGR